MEASAARPGTWRRDLADIVRSARVNKNISTLLLVVTGSLASGMGTRLDVSLGLSLLGLLLAMTAATQINVLTDRELDARSKPGLALLLTNNRLTAPAIGFQLLAVAAIVSVLAARGNWRAGVSLLAASLFAVLYSYNFLPGFSPIAHRWKVHWASHFLAFFGGYTAMYLTGYYCERDPETIRISASAMVPLFALTAAADYGLYLTESGLDAEEEHHQRLATLPALVGNVSTVRVGVLICAASMVGATALVLKDSLAYPFLLGAIARTGYVSILIVLMRRHLSAARALQLRASDYVFHGARLITAAALVMQT